MQLITPYLPDDQADEEEHDEILNNYESQIISGHCNYFKNERYHSRYLSEFEDHNLVHQHKHGVVELGFRVHLRQGIGINELIFSQNIINIIIY